ncbi:hypothetical protein RQN30_02840 [Arcanobacterium hippocoleae]
MKNFETESAVMPGSETHNGCGCNGNKHQQSIDGQAGNNRGSCGCGGHGKKHGVRTANTPRDIADDFSGGRHQLGLRGK